MVAIAGVGEDAFEPVAHQRLYVRDDLGQRMPVTWVALQGAPEQSFALKGRTAINLFIRYMRRLSAQGGGQRFVSAKQRRPPSSRMAASG